MGILIQIQAIIREERTQLLIILKMEINGADPASGFYQLFDDKGIMLTKKEKILHNNVDISKLASGTYYIWIYSEGTYVSRKFVKI